MILQIPPAASRELVADDRELHQPQSAQNLVDAVAVKGREGVRVLGQMRGNLVHLRGLIH